MVPEETPETLPEASTVATAMLLLLHVPPVTASVKVDVVPVQTKVRPEIVPASAEVPTVTPAVTIAEPQLVVTVYVIVAEPVATPVTTPVAETVAIEILLLLHVPPLTASARVVVAPVQTDVVPVILPAVPEPTVTEVVALAVPQLLVIV